jgi:hypothetical protein
VVGGQEQPAVQRAVGGACGSGEPRAVEQRVDADACPGEEVGVGV